MASDGGDNRIVEGAEFWQSVAEHMPQPAWVADADGAIFWYNKRWYEFTGTDIDQMQGWGWQAVHHPDHVDGVTERWREAIASGAPFEDVFPLRGADGEFREFLTRAQPMRDSTGAITHWVGSNTDVTAQAESERALRESDQRYRGLFEAIDEGFCVIEMIYDANGRPCDYRWIEANRAFAEQSGLDDVIGRTIRDFAPDHEQWWFDIYAKVATSGESIRFTHRADELGRAFDCYAFRFGEAENGHVAVLFKDVTAAEEAATLLRTSEGRFRAAIAAVEGVLWTNNAAGEMFGRQEAWSALTGQTEVQYQGYGWADAVHPDDAQATVEAWNANLAERGIFQFEHRVRRHDGEWRHFSIRAIPIVDAQGDLTEWVGVHTDITERKEAEAIFRTRLNAIPQMVWSTLADGYHDFYNDRWYEYTGAPQGTTDGSAWEDMFHADEREEAWSRWRHSLATGHPYEIEYRLRHYSGEYRWVLGRALPVLNEAGDIIRWMGTCTDIHALKLAESAVRDSEARLLTVIESMPVGLVFADAEGRITGGNSQVEKILGAPVTHSDAIEEYRDDYVAYHADGRRVQAGEYPLAKVLRGETEKPELECVVERRDGSRLWVRYVAAPIRNSSGVITGGVVASLDVDREKRLTESLEREVERVVAEREAAQEALRQSQKLEAMGQLTGGVAHDFNNLLTPIIGSLDLLHRKQLGDARMQRLVDGALQSAERAKVLVQRLLAFARRQPLQTTAVDVGRVVTEISDLIGSTSGPRVKLQIVIEPDLPRAQADGNQLEMALLNLSVNARDAMPDGGNLGISVRRETLAQSSADLRAGEHVVLAVSDTGEGMDADTVRRCIEPFFSTKGIGKGTGLGLSMVHGLAAQLGGALRIHSAPGVGTAIELWLPVADAVADAPAAIAAPTAEEEPSSTGRVLLIDDEELVRAATGEMLIELGYAVVEAASAEAALDLVRGGLVPDLLVTDQLMPGMTGTQFAQMIRVQQPKLPVLIVSGYADVDSLSEDFHHLAKPFRHADLEAALAAMTATS